MFFNAPTPDSRPVAVREPAVLSALPDALGVASSPSHLVGCGALRPERTRPWTGCRTSGRFTGRRAAIARKLAVNVGQLVLRMEDGDPIDVATHRSPTRNDPASVYGIRCHQGRLTHRRECGRDYGFLYSPRGGKA